MLRRIGARDPVGIKRTLRQYDVETIPELIEYLEHHKPDRNFKARFILMIGRYIGGSRAEPHAQDIRKAYRQLHDNKNTALRDRVQKAKHI